MNQQLIAFATDFGTVDPCVGICEGVMLGIAPEARVIHLNHNISPQNINEAIFNFFIAYKYFPDKTVFCFVVDPGVGSQRLAIAIEYRLADGRTQYLVCPDNGIATPLLNHEQIHKIVSLDKPGYHLPHISTTFHGRDIFSPIAAHLAKGTDISCLGQELEASRLVKLALPQPRLENNVWEAEIIHVDRFGNLVSNLPSKNLNLALAQWSVESSEKQLSPIYPSFASVNIGETVAYTGSSGFIEIGVRNRNAQELLGLTTGGKIRVTLASRSNVTSLGKVVSSNN